MPSGTLAVFCFNAMMIGLLESLKNCHRQTQARLYEYEALGI